MTTLVTVDNNGEVFTHFPDLTGNYATLCQLDGADENPGVNQVELDVVGKVDCRDCIALFYFVRLLRVSDIDKRHKRPKGAAQ